LNSNSRSTRSLSSRSRSFNNEGEGDGIRSIGIPVELDIVVPVDELVVCVNGDMKLPALDVDAWPCCERCLAFDDDTS
jgi:hypothetical protein